MKVVISSGHGKYIRGAAGPAPWGLDEVNEARKVVEQAATFLRELGVDATTFHDNTSHDQSTNLHTIVNFHNGQGPHDLDISVHFNAYQTTSKPMGCEVLFVSGAGQEIATDVVNAICTSSGLINRGAKKRTDLAFLNGTNEVAVLIETCFCDSHSDSDTYRARFTDICAAIAKSIAGEAIAPGPDPEPPGALFEATGRCSTFGGPDDTGVSPSEGLAFISDFMQAPQLFLPYQPSGTSGLARRLNPHVHYIACRWNYETTSRELLRSRAVARVHAPNTGVTLTAFPADWGPAEHTNRIADLSPSLMADLQIETDDAVEVMFPWDDAPGIA